MWIITLLGSQNFRKTNATRHNHWSKSIGTRLRAAPRLLRCVREASVGGLYERAATETSRNKLKVGCQKPVRKNFFRSFSLVFTVRTDINTALSPQPPFLHCSFSLSTLLLRKVCFYSHALQFGVACACSSDDSSSTINFPFDLIDHGEIIPALSLSAVNTCQYTLLMNPHARQVCLLQRV